MNDFIPDRIKQEILAIQWFINAGKTNSNIKNAIFISAPKKASEHIASIDWENTTLEASNNIHAFLYKKNLHHELALWNTLAEEARTFIAKEVIPNLPTVENIDRLNIENDISWNLSGFIIESYFSNRIPKEQRFFNELIKIYKLGNIPCGLQGKYPSGMFFVY